MFTFQGHALQDRRRGRGHTSEAEANLPLITMQTPQPNLYSCTAYTARVVPGFARRECDTFPDEAEGIKPLITIVPNVVKSWPLKHLTIKYPISV